MLQKGKGLMTDNNYGFVSNEIIRDGTLTPESRILYAILATYSNQDRKCYSTINELIKASRNVSDHVLSAYEKPGRERDHQKIL